MTLYDVWIIDRNTYNESIEDNNFFEINNFKILRYYLKKITILRENNNFRKTCMRLTFKPYQKNLINDFLDSE